MNKQNILVIVGILIVLTIGGIFLFRQPKQENPVLTPPVSTSTPSIPPVATSTPPTTSPTSTPDLSDRIHVTEPVANQLVRSPLVVRGEARGFWYFEASFPVRLLDANGYELALAPAQAQSDWMTESFVPFEVRLSFTTPTTETGTLVLQNDNPSGLPENAFEQRIPVRFDLSQPVTATNTRIIQVFAYNAEKDKDASGNILCSSQGLVAVSRTIPFTNSPIRDALTTLLQEGLRAQERAQGLTSEFPLPGFQLKLAFLKGSELTLTFADPENRTTGGSCRTAILRAQIEATAKQFGGVSRVRMLPETILQP